MKTKVFLILISAILCVCSCSVKDDETSKEVSRDIFLNVSEETSTERLPEVSLEESSDELIMPSDFPVYIGEIYDQGFTYFEYDTCVSLYEYNENYSNSKVIEIPERVNGKLVTSIISTAFEYCEILEEVILPSGITSLPSRTFVNCPNLQRVILPENFKVLFYNVFENCKSLSEINIPDTAERVFTQSNSLSEWHDSLEDEFVILGDGVLYKYNGEGGTVTVPQGVKVINPSVFGENVTEIILPEGVTVIEDLAFAYCPNLEKINLPETLTEIGYDAFQGCTKITELHIPDNLLKIGAYAFEGTAWYGSLDDMFVITDGGALIKYNGAGGVVTIPENVKSVGGGVFSQREDLSEVVLPDGIIYICNEAFRACTYLYNINFPNSIEAIGDSAFSNCISLIDVTLPENLKTVGEYAFNNCNGIKTFVMSQSIEEIGYDAFEGFSGLSTVYCYEGSLAEEYLISHGESHHTIKQ